MKKIKFGYTNDSYPTGSHESMWINPDLPLCDADYYGAVKYENDSYIVAKVTDDKYGRYPHLLGNFIVRPAIADMYVDGSGNIFLDKEESEISKQMEQHLNNPEIRDRISDINDVKNYCRGTYMADKSFQFLALNDVVYTCSIRHEIFERKNEALKRCQNSFSQLQEKLLSIENSYKRR